MKTFSGAGIIPQLVPFALLLALGLSARSQSVGFTLSASTLGGGAVTVNPAQASYAPGSMVQVVATPASGSILLGWTGDLDGTDLTNAVRMTKDKCVEAVFGAPFFAKSSGNGSNFLNPPGGIYPYGTLVTVYPVPASNGFVLAWGDYFPGLITPGQIAFTGGLYFGYAVLAEVVFGTLGSNQCSLAYLPDGDGQVSADPPTNRFSLGQHVTVSAQAGPGQTFLNWSGDATGNQNPLTLTMDRSKSVRAHFSKIPTLRIAPCFGGSSEAGLRFLLQGDWGSRYRIEWSSNLVHWTPLFTITNRFGATQVTDPSATNASTRDYRAVLVP